MEKNNKKRILKLLNILRKETNDEKRLSLNEITSLLNKEAIEVANRKTLYDDIKVLNEVGFDIEYDDGYYLLEAPFSLAEIKIILDSLNSLKNLDNKLLTNLSNKLYTFISEDEVKLLESLKYQPKHQDRLLLQRMEDVLYAIKHHYGIKINRKDDLLFPLFIYRTNDYYYFYYHYQNKEKIYHYRFDNINDLKLAQVIDQQAISHKKIIDHIEASSNAYYKGKTTLVNLKINNPGSNLEQRITDDFPTAIRTKDGYSLKANINNIFFAKLTAYGSDIEILNLEVAKEYLTYLDSIKAIYQQNS